MRRLAPLLCAVLVLPGALIAQTRPGDTLTVAAATKLLGTAPMAVPDLTVRSITRMSGEEILLEQQLPSGEVVWFTEQRGSWMPASSTASATDELRTTTRAALSGQLLPAERRLLNRRAHRTFENLTVGVVSWDDERIALLDRLQPMKP